jgi:hypothetical protein
MHSQQKDKWIDIFARNRQLVASSDDQQFVKSSRYAGSHIRFSWLQSMH